MRIAAGIEYLGTAYCGWQSQSDASSVQSEVEKAFSFVADSPITVFCAGRTDRGVHATGQVIHFDTEAERSDYAWLCGANSILPSDIVVTWIKRIADDFHARFSAQARAYRYVLYNSSIRPAIFRPLATWHFGKLDVSRMQEAAQHLLGTHDFTSFRTVACQAKSPIRTIQAITIERQGDFIVLDIKANGFLHHMVRNIMGVLIKIGEDKAPVDWPVELLKHGDRTLAAMTAPENGLYLSEVFYDEKWGLPLFPTKKLFFL